MTGSHIYLTQQDHLSIFRSLSDSNTQFLLSWGLWSMLVEIEFGFDVDRHTGLVETVEVCFA